MPKEYEEEIESIVNIFKTISEIPHGSGMESELGEYLKLSLLSMGAELEQDEAGNILGTFSPGDIYADAPTVVLQAHMDMVVAGDVPASKAKVHVLEDKGYLKTDGHTSLGADNGIGIATILNLVSHGPDCFGPLKVLFTVSEETGLKGARNVSRDWLKDADYMINTDGFHVDTEIVGCKSGIRETFSRKLLTDRVKDSVDFHTRKKNQLEETELYEVKLEGFLGGHSGDDIDKHRCNSIHQMAEMLQDVQDKYDMRIADLRGGVGYNVIPPDCTAIVAVPRACRLSAAKILVRDETRMHKIYEKSDPTGKLTVHWLGETATGELLWDYEFQRDVLRFLTALSDGVDATDKNGDVSSSSNLGQIITENDTLIIGDMIRCDTDYQENHIINNHEMVAIESGFQVERTGYHSWHSPEENELADIVASVYETILKKPMNRKVAKVGLEPAFFHEIAPDMSIICLGAEISNAHSVEENVTIESIGLLYKLISGTLSQIAKCSKKKTRV